MAFAASAVGSDLDTRGRQFIGLATFRNFVESTNGLTAETTLTTPPIHARIRFNETVVSWNANVPPESYLRIEARAVYSNRITKYYTLGVWSTSSGRHPRTSVSEQNDTDGDVRTDTLVLRHPADALQVRLVLGGEGTKRPSLKFLGVSLADSQASPPLLTSDRTAWGKILEVPERTQMAYPNGKTLCSPTTVSMLLGYWSANLSRPELDQGVPKIVDAIYDTQWQGTGNWPFNMAYAGSFPGMRAYVTRLSDVAELETWIARDIPVGLSVDYDRLRGKGPGPNGHLVVCVGFTKEGDPVINDPGTSRNVRKTFPRHNLVDAWSCSRNTVYLVYPENASIPADLFGHWASKF